MSKPPTYELGPDFYQRLAEFVEHTSRTGFTEFAHEFRRLDGYLKQAEADSSLDHSSLRRTPKEMYLLEAMAFHVMDQHNREAFNNAKDTLIVIPDCLSLHNPGCLKTDEEWGDRCQGCVPDCQAWTVCELGEKYGVETVFSKRKLSEQLEHYAEHADTLSVIGIACLMMLANGMRTAREVGVPARGVLLNFSGCEHWSDEPFASEFTMRRLEAILEEKYGPRD